jgi:hypothetical protein
MSTPLLRQAEVALRQLLATSADVIKLVSSEGIAVDAVNKTRPRPYIVFGKSEPAEFINGLSGTVLAMRARIEVQCVANSSLEAATVADTVRLALAAQGQAVESSQPGRDAELGVDLESLSLDWWITP